MVFDAPKTELEGPERWGHCIKKKTPDEKSKSGL